MLNFKDVQRLAVIRFRLRQVAPENRNVITEDMQWLADKLLAEWKDREVTDGNKEAGRN